MISRIRWVAWLGSALKTAVADALADAAEWPDAVARDEYTQSISWHFIDLGVKPNPAKDGPLWQSADTAFAKIIKYFGTVQRGDKDELESGSDLKQASRRIPAQSPFLQPPCKANTYNKRLQLFQPQPTKESAWPDGQFLAQGFII